MTLEDIKNIVGLFHMGYVPPGQFETMYFDAELKLYYLKYGERDYESLRFFEYVMGDQTPPLLVTNGRADVPSDYQRVMSGYYMNATVPHDINFVDAQEYDRLINHDIEFPTAKYPIGNVQDTFIRFRPADAFKHAVFTYLTKPVMPVYATTEARGFVEFDASGSSVVKWDTDNVVLLIQNILQGLGIIANQSDIKSKIEKS